MTPDPHTTPRRHRALIVEDDPAIRRLAEKLLSRHQIDIDTASDGKIAVDLIRQHDYSVLILDLMIPEMDGFELIDHLRAEGKKIPVVVVSAVSQQALDRLDRDIVKLVISKPFDVNEFTRGVLSLCEKR